MIAHCDKCGLPSFVFDPRNEREADRVCMFVVLCKRCCDKLDKMRTKFSWREEEEDETE